MNEKLETRAIGGRWMGNRLHAINCMCSECNEDERLRETRVVRDAPTGSLPSQSVSLQELVDNATLTLAPRYSIGEDWNDD